MGRQRSLRRFDAGVPGLWAWARPRCATALVEWATDGLVADLSVLVDVPVEVAAARLAAGPGSAARLDRMERLGPAFAARVRDGFLAQAAADPEHWLVVNGEASVGELAAHIVASVRGRFEDVPATR